MLLLLLSDGVNAKRRCKMPERQYSDGVVSYVYDMMLMMLVNVNDA